MNVRFGHVRPHRVRATRWAPAALLFAVLALIALNSLATAGSVKCKTCGQIITGDYIEAGGAFYHPQHFTCSHCGKPIKGNYFVRDGKVYDAACYERFVALRCAVCGKPLGESYSEDYWKNPYHTEHERDTPRCEYCGRLISERLTGGGVQYADGRHICELCRRPAVTGLNEASGLMTEVSRQLAKIGLQVETREIHLELVGRDRLGAMSGKRGDNLKGFTHYTERSDDSEMNRTIDVYILYGMPRADTIFSLAHELTHVWQDVHGRADNDETFSEGSCNYAAQLVLQSYPSDYSRYLLDGLSASSDPVYGEGFRRVRRFAQERGTAQWLSALKSQDRLPAGY